MPDVSTVVVLTFPDALLLNGSGPLEVFGAIPRVLGGRFASHPPYRLLMASPFGGLVESVSGIEVMTRSLAWLDEHTPRIDTLVVVGARGWRHWKSMRTSATGCDNALEPLGASAR